MELRTACHPEASGRTPIPGEYQYELLIPLEGGDTLRLCMGEQGHEALRSMFVQEFIDEEVEKTLSNGI